MMSLHSRLASVSGPFYRSATSTFLDSSFSPILQLIKIISLGILPIKSSLYQKYAYIVIIVELKSYRIFFLFTNHLASTCNTSSIHFDQPAQKDLCALILIPSEHILWFIEWIAINFKCFRVQLNETDAQKQSTVESSYPNIPGSSGLIDTGIPRPSNMGAFDNLRSSLAEEAIIRLEIGQSSKHTFAQMGKI